jgi:hypothetical protein
MQNIGVTLPKKGKPFKEAITKKATTHFRNCQKPHTILLVFLEKVGKDSTVVPDVTLPNHLKDSQTL